MCSLHYTDAMSNVITMPAWMPNIPSVPASTLNEASIKGSSMQEVQTASGQPMMSPEALRAMLERNMGQPLIRVNLGDK